MKTSVLKPGLLVSLKTSLAGGVHYQRRDLESGTDEAGAAIAKWETLREIPDPAEYERAQSARNKARSLISSACFSSSFGLLCPSADEQKLQEAIEAARAVERAHNAGAKLTRVQVYVIVGRIAQDDAEAARAIASELRQLIGDMQEGIKSADPTAIREAATKAKNLGGMLSPDAAAKISGAILEARTAARLIARRVQKAGELAADVVKEVSTARITAARFAFLDIDENAPEVEPQAAPARGIDLEAQPEAPRSAAAPELPFALEV